LDLFQVGINGVTDDAVAKLITALDQRRGHLSEPELLGTFEESVLEQSAFAPSHSDDASPP
jgi:hypothetical protein